MTEKNGEVQVHPSLCNTDSEQMTASARCRQMTTEPLKLDALSETSAGCCLRLRAPCDSARSGGDVGSTFEILREKVHAACCSSLCLHNTVKLGHVNRFQSRAVCLLTTLFHTLSLTHTHPLPVVCCSASVSAPDTPSHSSTLHLQASVPSCHCIVHASFCCMQYHLHM